METVKTLTDTASKQKKRSFYKKIFISLLFAIILFNGFISQIPVGTSYEGDLHQVSDISFLYDLTYEKGGEILQEQTIFQEQLKLIEAAETFIVADLFLFNDDYDRKDQFPDLSGQLTQALITQKKKNPGLQVVFITDEINNFYGAYESKQIQALKENDIEVVITDTTKMRNSNPLYSGIWKALLQWFGTEGKGWVRNPFSPDSPKVTLRAYLKLLNFKANHRKVLITEDAAIVTSANPHDASGNHSNIGFRVEGSILKDLIQSERAVAQFSGSDFPELIVNTKAEVVGDTQAAVITEGKIRKHILHAINHAQPGEQISIGMFYLSERKIIDALIKASNRGAEIRIILDANKDAFGIEKNGIPNRQAAMELVKKSQEKIQVRWYNTHGEQYHAKMMMVEKRNEVIIIGGSANFTGRNIGDYNLETNLKIETTTDSTLAREIRAYYDRLWKNEEGQYTVDFSEYAEDKFFKNVVYRFQEWSGLSTF
ncbi:phospholipase D family protein [Geosporobacter ferrireducens]|uniref:phospholipase D family protein n=1 Tax=Geosporobacter ferrireducens TaxID=1424294 RepID=UPI00139E525B|nr:phospholipase D family protein [Geosporobacter ferrireducens]MTI55761.1 phospholipase [Geosporobacter ferrireducens]